MLALLFTCMGYKHAMLCHVTSCLMHLVGLLQNLLSCIVIKFERLHKRYYSM